MLEKTKKTKKNKKKEKEKKKEEKKKEKKKKKWPQRGVKPPETGRKIEFFFNAKRNRNEIEAPQKYQILSPRQKEKENEKNEKMKGIKK